MGCIYRRKKKLEDGTLIETGPYWLKYYRHGRPICASAETEVYADAKAKLRALADFAEQYGDRFVRIDSISQAADGTLRSLDLKDADVRKAVRSFEGGKIAPLYVSSHGVLYK